MQGIRATAGVAGADGADWAWAVADHASPCGSGRGEKGSRRWGRGSAEGGTGGGRSPDRHHGRKQHPAWPAVRDMGSFASDEAWAAPGAMPRPAFTYRPNGARNCGRTHVLINKICPELFARSTPATNSEIDPALAVVTSSSSFWAWFLRRCGGPESPRLAAVPRPSRACAAARGEAAPVHLTEHLHIADRIEPEAGRMRRATTGSSTRAASVTILFPTIVLNLVAKPTT